jgi:hypothetical protein
MFPQWNTTVQEMEHGGKRGRDRFTQPADETRDSVAPVWVARGLLDAAA